jgi:hypothetical protein
VEMILKSSVLSSRFGNAEGAPGLVSTQWKVNCPKKPWRGMIGLSRWSVVEEKSRCANSALDRCELRSAHRISKHDPLVA